MSSFPPLLLLSATLAPLEWGWGGGLFSSSKFSFKGIDFINDSFIVLECCASNCYCSNLYKTGTSTKQPLLPSLCELLYKCLPKLCCSQWEKVLYRLPRHNKKNKTLGGGPPPTHQCRFIYSYYSRGGQSSLLITWWVFYKLSILHSPIFGLRLI